MAISNKYLGVKMIRIRDVGKIRIWTGRLTKKS